MTTGLLQDATRLALVRHGLARCNVDGVIGGRRGCTGLTDLGRDQARRLGDRLLAEHGDSAITAVYASPLLRARQTAEIVTGQLGLPFTVEDDLREPDYGEADGARWADVVAAFGMVPNEHPDLPIACGAEPWTAYLARVGAALNAVLARHPGGNVLVVGHGETVSAAAYLFLGLDARTQRSAGFEVYHASITRWRQQPLSATNPDLGRRWALVTHNDTAHLLPRPRQRD